MLYLLSKLFIKDHNAYDKPSVRRAYGVLCGCCGIAFNLLLFAAKLAAGLISRSVAVSADAFNNLADAGSSIITLTGFKLAGQKADQEHPFGHGRIEYIAGFLVSAAIILMGFELFKTSAERILHPSETLVSPAVLIILAVSILVKLYMAVYNRAIGGRIASRTLKAAATDSITDCAATGVVLISSLISVRFNIRIDGWCGMAVSLFVFISGIASIKDTVTPLLGRTPDPEFVKKVESIVLSFDGITGIHDLIVHDYGPGRIIISLHAEMPAGAGADIFKMHDIVNGAENRLNSELGCAATIHLDPTAVGDERIDKLKAKVTELITAMDPALTLHDFRVIPGAAETKLIFDVVVPFGFRLSDEEVRAAICSAVEKLPPQFDEPEKYTASVMIDRPMDG